MLPHEIRALVIHRLAMALAAAWQREQATNSEGPMALDKARSPRESGEVPDGSQTPKGRLAAQVDGRG